MIRYDDKDGRWINVILGTRDIGVGQADSGPDHPGIAFAQLDRPYAKGEPIPQELIEKTFNVVITTLNEAGYAALWGAVKNLGVRKGWDQKTISDNIYESLMHRLGDANLEIKRLQYELDQVKKS